MASKSLRRDVQAIRDEFPQDTSIDGAKISPHTSICAIWDAETWAQHRSSYRYWDNVLRISVSTVLRANWHSIAFFVAWGQVVRLLDVGRLPLAPLTLQASSIGLLLVFRTNQAGARVSEARRAMGTITRASTDAAALLRTRGAAAAAIDVASRYLALTLWALKAFVRPGDAASHAAFETWLPPAERLWVAKHQGFDDRLSPSTIVLRLRYALRDVRLPPDIDDRVESAITELASAFGGCGRIFTAPPPPGYVRHVSRSLVAWLLLLPCAISHLHDTALGLAVTTTVTAYLLFGIDEIASQIEEAFSVLPIHELAFRLSFQVAAIVEGPEPPPLPQSDAPTFKNGHS